MRSGLVQVAICFILISIIIYLVRFEILFVLSNFLGNNHSNSEDDRSSSLPRQNWFSRQYQQILEVASKEGFTRYPYPQPP